MNTFRFAAPHQGVFDTQPDPTPGEGELLVSIRRLGLCGSDLKTYTGMNPMVEFPIVPGHEIGAEIVDVGRNVPAWYHKGRRGTVIPYSSCGECPACRNGRVNTCANNRTLGVGRDGAARPLMTVHHADFVLGDGLTFDQLALVEPMSVATHAACQAGEANGRAVLLFGFGLIGIGIMKELQRRGATVIVTDISPAKLELARVMGANHTVPVDGERFADQVRDVSGSWGPEVCIDAVGADEVVTMCLETVCVSGRVVFLGYHAGTVAFNTKPIVSKELTVCGTRNALREDFEQTIRSLPAAFPDTTQLVSSRFEFAAMDEAFDFWKRNRTDVIKLLIDFPSVLK